MTARGSAAVLGGCIPPAAASRSRLALVAMLISFGCAQAVREGLDAAAAARDAHPIPLKTIGGEAGASDELLDSLDDEPVVAIVEMTRQIDLVALSAIHRREGLSRLAARERTLAAMRSLASETETRLARRVAKLRASGNVLSYRHLLHRNAAIVVADATGLSALIEEPDVAGIERAHDSVASTSRDVDGPGETPIPLGDAWPVASMGLRELWSEGVDGRGIVVASLDSGVFGRHAALAPGWRREKGWYEPGLHGDPDSDTPRDDAAHGTLVISGAVGREVDGRALGAAPGASWIAVLANAGGGYNSARMALAADWLLFVGRPDVILAAWGHGPSNCEDMDRRMIEAFRAAGMLPIFAAGNDGPDRASGQSPANLSGLAPDGRGPLAVGAIDRNDTIAPLSSRGPRGCGGSEPFPDLLGPGWNVPVARDVGNPALDDRLYVASGTSIAVGWVGGIAALAMQAAPEMPIHEVEDLLKGTARDVGAPGLDDDSGHGAVDARSAVEQARRWNELRARDH